jgi:DNA-binding FadR family transcriptional regulator
VDPSPLESVYRRRLFYQQIADDIERLIQMVPFQPDLRLPSEQEFAERYGVSRNVIREALKVEARSVWFPSIPAAAPTSADLQ